MGDYTSRTSNAELSDDSVLSADRVMPTHTLQANFAPPTMTSALAELEAANAADDEDQSEKRTKTGGRQKGTPNKVARVDIRKMASMFSLRALATLVECMEDADANWSDRNYAANAILDRAHGKAKQITEIGGFDGGDIQTKLTIEFIGQPPVKATVDAQLTDKVGEVIDMQLETVRVPEQRKPWDPA